MKKEEYKAIYDKEPDFIALENSDIKEWLDTIVDALNVAQSNAYELWWGKLADGEYDHRIAPCNPDYNSLHIYKGIEYLADVVGAKIETEVEEYENSTGFRHYFDYKGVRIFELCDTEDLSDK